MATFKVVVLPHQKKEDGTYNVKIRVTQNRKTKYIKTSQYVTASDLSKKKEKGVEKIKIKNQAILDLMDGIVLGFRTRLMSAGQQAESWDVDKVVEFLNSKEESTFKLNIIEYGYKCADMVEKQGRVTTARQHRVAMRALERFAGNILDVNDVTVSFLKSYERHLLQEPTYKGISAGQSVATTKPKAGRAVSLYMSHLKSILTQAKLEFNDEYNGKINIPLSPFDRYKIPKTQTSKHRTLTIEQIQQIINLPYSTARNSTCTTVNLAKDIFLLSFALMGINTVDLYELESYSEGIISFERRKTKTRRLDKAYMRIRVEEELLPIVNKYKGNNGKVFDFSERYKNYLIFNKVVNRGLKKIGNEIGVPYLNHYYARHSMASICANKLGIDIARVDEMLNHSDSSMALARVYIEKDFKPLWEANRKLIDLFDWSFYTGDIKLKPED